MHKPSIAPTPAVGWRRIIWTSRSVRVALVVVFLIACVLVMTLLAHLSVPVHVGAGGNNWG